MGTNRPGTGGTTFTIKLGGFNLISIPAKVISKPKKTKKGWKYKIELIKK